MEQLLVHVNLCNQCITYLINNKGRIIQFQCLPGCEIPSLLWPWCRSMIGQYSTFSGQSSHPRLGSGGIGRISSVVHKQPITLVVCIAGYRTMCGCCDESSLPRHSDNTGVVSRMKQKINNIHCRSCRWLLNACQVDCDCWCLRCRRRGKQVSR